MTTNSLPTCPACKRTHKTRAKLILCMDRKFNPTLLQLLLVPHGRTTIEGRQRQREQNALLRALRVAVKATPDDGAKL